MDGTKLNNPGDPLRRVNEAGQELFKRFGRVASQEAFPIEAVLDASVNMMINCLRQTYPNGRDAEARYDELVAKLRGVLREHYDPVTGKRRSIFPFTQNITPQFFADKDKVQGQ